MLRLKVLGILVFATALAVGCSDDDTNGGTTDTGQTGGDAAVDTGSDDAGVDTGSDEDVQQTDVVADPFVTLTGTLSLAGGIDPTTEGGGFIVFLLPDGYTLTGDPSGDVIAALIVEVEIGYTGDAHALTEEDGVLAIWDDSGDEFPLGDPWEGVAGDYTLFIGFMANFDGGDDGPSHVLMVPASPGDPAFAIESVPSVVELGDLVLQAMTD